MKMGLIRKARFEMNINAIVFDLDQTLVDTSKIEGFRNHQQWEDCYQHFHQTYMIPTVKEFLQHARPWKIGVVTNSPHEYAKRLLEYHDIPYDSLIAYQHGKNKPYPNQLLSCAEELQVEPRRSIYIGDDTIDIIAAKAAGFKAIGYASNKAEIKRFIPFMPELIITNYYEIRQFLHQQDESWKRKMISLYQSGREAKRRKSDIAYIKYLLEASKMGHSESLFTLARLLEKNTELPLVNRSKEYYYWESIKRMYPEAIYLLGYYNEQNNREDAIRFYRTAANLGCPQAQYHFSKMKLSAHDSSHSLPIAYHWLEKADISGLRQSKLLLGKIEKIMGYEKSLNNHFRFDRSNRIFYIDHYHPDKRYEDPFSKNILRVKDLDKDAIAYFMQKITLLEQKELVLCYVPSSDREKKMTGIRKIAQLLLRFPESDGTACLVRTETREKSSLGGERKEDTHLCTLVVENEKKIIGKHILLMDDVTTTGSAMRACEQLLYKHGAFHVTKLALGKTKSK